MLCIGLGTRNFDSSLIHFLKYDFQTMLLSFCLDVNAYFCIYFGETFFYVPSSIFVCY
jgi:hypothetical protein